jgi:hypothetical protein
VLADQVGDPAQQPDPLASPQPRPGPLVEGPPRGADGQVDIVRTGDRERGHLLARGRMTVAPRLAGPGRAPLPVDQQGAVAEACLVAVRLDRCDHR